MVYNDTVLKTYETSDKIYKFTIRIGNDDSFQLLFLKENSIYNITLPLNSTVLPEATEVLQLNIDNVTDNDNIFIFTAEKKNFNKSKNDISSEFTAWRVSVLGVFLVRILSHFQSEGGKIWTRKTQNTDTLHAVVHLHIASYFHTRGSQFHMHSFFLKEILIAPLRSA